MTGTCSSADAVALHRAERLAEFPQQLRVHVDEGKLRILGPPGPALRERHRLDPDALRRQMVDAACGHLRLSAVPRSHTGPSLDT